MSRSRSFGIAAIFAASTSVGFAQSWNQPWYVTSAEGWGPGVVESRVDDCFPTKLRKMAVVDDFRATGRPVKRVVWWGTVLSREQLQYPFLIAFYKEVPESCKPNLEKVIYQCVPARASLAGYDCNKRRIWKFVADLPFWFVGAEGEKHWIQISEIDTRSWRVGYSDFRWAFHLRSPNYSSWNTCAALGFDPALNLFNITDPCTKEARDMAFQLFP
ncbi:MAG TPA: hypothetical protein VGE01_08335 [Fimbriimonas sp.]